MLCSSRYKIHWEMDAVSVGHLRVLLLSFNVILLRACLNLSQWNQQDLKDTRALAPMYHLYTKGSSQLSIALECDQQKNMLRQGQERENTGKKNTLVSEG